MKSLILLTILVSSFAAEAAPKKQCPTGTTEVMTCVSQSSIPLYPFISACVDQNGKSALAMNVGAGRNSDILKADRVKTDSSITFSVTEEDSDDVAFTYTKQSLAKTNGVLTFTMWGSEIEDNYSCKIN